MRWRRTCSSPTSGDLSLAGSGQPMETVVRRLEGGGMCDSLTMRRSCSSKPKSIT